MRSYCKLTIRYTEKAKENNFVENLIPYPKVIFTLRFNKLTVKPQTGFGEKAYPERNVAAAILYIFFEGVKNEKWTLVYRNQFA